MGNPNCCFMIIAGIFFFSSQSSRGTVKYLFSNYAYLHFIGKRSKIKSMHTWENLCPIFFLTWAEASLFEFGKDENLAIKNVHMYSWFLLRRLAPNSRYFAVFDEIWSWNEHCDFFYGEWWLIRIHKWHQWH